MRRLLLPALLALLSFPIPPAQAQPAPPDWAPPPYLLLGPGGQPIARVITTAETCPPAFLAGMSVPMRVRAAPSPAFPVLTCELPVPPSTFAVTINGVTLPLPTATPQRIAVIGDTGCRLRGAEIQDCNDPSAWPFATVVASIAAMRPDLILHVGDYLYRESPCPPDRPGCAGSPYGQNWASWRADFFEPAGPLLSQAPWVFVRGNHEDCARAWEGWFRFLDPHPYHPSCQPASEPWVVPLAGLSLLVLDSSSLSDTELRPAEVALARRHLDALLAQQRGPAWLLTHRPPYGVGHFSNRPAAQPSNVVLAAAAPARWPEQLTAIVSGHIHLWGVVAFSPSPSQRPVQWVIGFSGTSLDPWSDPILEGMSVAGELVTAGSRNLPQEFGFLTFEPAGNSWLAVARDRNGFPFVRCRQEGKQVRCA
ncbi:MAG: hypothetical protein KatS3mg061_2490 [Dehalococcoidia bacterium]|nr:MAG: hypothetical protein KatS3mg061_2490 [Dehalococcoidia bacterium]